QVPGAVDELDRLLLVGRDAERAYTGSGQALPNGVADPEPTDSELSGFEPDQHLLPEVVVQLVALPVPAVRELEAELLARLGVDPDRVPQPVGRVPRRLLPLLDHLRGQLSDGGAGVESNIGHAL